MEPSLAASGAVPALVAMWYFDRVDAKRPEPRKTLRLAAVVGAVSVIPVIAIGAALMPMAPPVGTLEHAAFLSFIVAALVEETAKLLCVRWFLWHRPEFDERLDGIVYAARVGLGFALVENVMYLLGTATMGDFVTMYIGRALLAVPGHAIWAGLIGYFAARKRFDRVGPGMLGGLAIAVFLHGIYDFAVFSMPIVSAEGAGNLALLLFLVPIAVVAVGATWLRKLARHALLLDDAAEAAHARAIAHSEPHGGAGGAGGGS